MSADAKRLEKIGETVRCALAKRLHAEDDKRKEAVAVARELELDAMLDAEEGLGWVGPDGEVLVGFDNALEVWREWARRTFRMRDI